MEAVFVFHHVRSDDEYGDNAKLIGIYQTASAAEAAMKRLAYKPGSVDHPTGWHATATNSIKITGPRALA